MQQGHTMRMNFMARKYATAAKVKQLHYFTRLNKEFWWDITNLTPNDCQILQYIIAVQNITMVVDQ